MTSLKAVQQTSRPAAPHRRALTLEIVRSEEGFLALEPFWDVLVEQMATRSPFLRWDWVSLWWQNCRRQGSSLVIAFLQDEEGVPHAIAPLMLAREDDRARHYLTALTFLSGFGSAHGERLDFIVPAGSEDELSPRLCRVFKLLRSECDVVRLPKLRELTRRGETRSEGYTESSVWSEFWLDEPELVALRRAGFRVEAVRTR